MVFKKCTDFISDFEHVAMVLEKKDKIDEETLKAQTGLIDIFAHVFYKKLKPSEIIVDLYSKRVLNKEAFEAVMRDEQHNGESSATIVLIDNIWRFHKNWFNIFLEALCKHDYKYIVKEIDPSFLESEYLHVLGFFFTINIFGNTCSTNGGYICKCMWNHIICGTWPNNLFWCVTAGAQLFPRAK